MSVDDIPPPVIQIGPTNQTLPKGSVATLSCRATGTPTPDVKWFKDGTAVQSKSRFVIVQSGTLKIDGKRYFAIQLTEFAQLRKVACGDLSLSLPPKTPLSFPGNIRTEMAIIGNLIKTE